MEQGLRMLRLVGGPCLENMSHLAHAELDCVFWDSKTPFCVVCAISNLSSTSLGMAKSEALLQDLHMVRR
jgi:hypothetical protein